eukprot:SAG31_NODE_850_length_11521_cov_47.558396_8_plen_57_part_00
MHAMHLVLVIKNFYFCYHVGTIQHSKLHVEMAVANTLQADITLNSMNSLTHFAIHG